MAEKTSEREVEIGDLIMVRFVDHCSDDSDMTLEEIREEPLRPPECASVGFKTYEDEGFIMIASEVTDHGEGSGDDVTYSNHTSILKEAILEIKPLMEVS